MAPDDSEQAWHELCRVLGDVTRLSHTPIRYEQTLHHGPRYDVLPASPADAEHLIRYDPMCGQHRRHIQLVAAIRLRDFLTFDPRDRRVAVSRGPLDQETATSDDLLRMVVQSPAALNAERKIASEEAMRSRKPYLDVWRNYCVGELIRQDGEDLAHPLKQMSGAIVRCIDHILEEPEHAERFDDRWPGVGKTQAEYLTGQLPAGPILDSEIADEWARSLGLLDRYEWRAWNSTPYRLQ